MIKGRLKEIINIMKKEVLMIWNAQRHPQAQLMPPAPQPEKTHLWGQLQHFCCKEIVILHMMDMKNIFQYKRFISFVTNGSILLNYVL